MIKNKAKARPSQFASALLELKGVKLEFDDYKPSQLGYDIDPDLMVLKAGRQVGKSVSQGGRLVIKSVIRSYFNSLYLAPLQIQTKRFSNMYLDPFIASPLVKKHFTDKNSTKNVYEKSFTNGSTIFLSYAENENDADRIRGIMADQLLVDEVQDVSFDALPPIFEILSASEHGFKVMSGTSKSVSNTLEQLWLQTNQLEWVCKCPHCNHYIIPNNYETCLVICSDDRGPVCDRCRKPYDVRTGKWIATVPGRDEKFGFHLPQFGMGANTTKKKWKRFRDKVTQAQEGGVYTPAKLANEAFGLATDLGGKAISVREAMACSNPLWTSWAYPHPEHRKIYKKVLGVDWSVTGSEKSYTVATVMGYTQDGKVFVLYSEKMQGSHILTQVDRVSYLFRTHGCEIIGSDRGVGVLQAQLLQKELGLMSVIPINYVSSNSKLKWNKEGMFLSADRTQAIDNVVMKIRLGRQRLETPNYEFMEHLWKDALDVFEEETRSNNRVYRHHPDEPDDWLHSLVFGNIAYQYITGDYEFTE